MGFAFLWRQRPRGDAPPSASRAYLELRPLAPFEIHDVRDEPLGLLADRENLVVAESSPLLVHEVIASQEEVPDEGTFNREQALLLLLPPLVTNLPGITMRFPAFAVRRCRMRRRLFS